jgi:hypothetical protein
MKYIPIFLAFFLLSTSVSAAPSFKHYYTGKKLLEMYSDSPDTLGLKGAAGIIAGVVETQDGITFCLPEKLTLFQLVDIVGRDLNKYPILEDIPAGRVVLGILTQKYPCQ